MANLKTTKKQQLTEAKSSEIFNNSHVFGELFEKDKNRLYAFIRAFVSDNTIADDIFQETCLYLWQEFDTFELGTNFSKWANVIAFYRVKNFLRVQNKYQLGLSDDFIQEFSQNIALMESKAISEEEQWRHLERCRSLLSAPLQQIYRSFYVDNYTAQNIANNTGRSIHAIRKAVHKLRKKIFDCVEQNGGEQ